MAANQSSVTLNRDDVKAAIEYWLAGTRGLKATGYHVEFWKEEVKVDVEEIANEPSKSN